RVGLTPGRTAARPGSAASGSESGAAFESAGALETPRPAGFGSMGTAQVLTGEDKVLINLQGALGLLRAPRSSSDPGSSSPPAVPSIETGRVADRTPRVADGEPAPSISRRPGQEPDTAREGHRRPFDPSRCGRR